jgi:hypothetical protein
LAETEDEWILTNIRFNYFDISTKGKEEIFRKTSDRWGFFNFKEQILIIILIVKISLIDSGVNINWEYLVKFIFLLFHYFSLDFSCIYLFVCYFLF